jgi:peptide/nickel transport system permease protein
VAVLEKKIPQPAPEPEEWQVELERVGLLRRVLNGRRWYGADWWFVMISGVMVVIFIAMALFPDFFAPYKPDQIVGPPLLAPGETPPASILIIKVDSPINSLRELAAPAGSPRPSIAVVQGVPSAVALNEEAQKIDNEIKNEPEGLRLRPRIERFSTVEEALQAVADDQALAAVVESTEFEAIAVQFPTLREGARVVAVVADSGGFLMGTNQLGQDVYSRLIYGTRVALLIGFTSSIAALLIGIPLGLFAGHNGGKADRGLSLLMDSMYAFPGLILAIAITAVLGPSIFNVIIAISVLYIPTYYRIVRGQTMSVKEEVFIEASRSIGARTREILWRYIFPNVIPSVAIIFSVSVADAILTGAGLSFLGLGLPPTIADWGIDLARGQRFIQTAWWLITFPGLAILLIVLAFTMMGEGLMEIFNPKLRDR